MIRFKKDLLLWDGKPLGFTAEASPGVKYVYIRDGSRVIFYESLRHVLGIDNPVPWSEAEFELQLAEIDAQDTFLQRVGHPEYERILLPQGKVIRVPKYTKFALTVPELIDEMDGSVYYAHQVQFFIEGLTGFLNDGTLGWD